jgi:hypothetical protein
LEHINSSTAAAMETKLDFSQQDIAEIQQQVSDAIDAEPTLKGAAAVSPAVCDNKDLIIGFLNTLVGLLPGPMGKIAGKLVIVAAQAYFDKVCPVKPAAAMK